MKTFIQISWLITLLGTCVAALLLFSGLAADSAPKQAAGAALACAVVVIPYVFTRAVEGMRALGEERTPSVQDRQ